MRGWEDYTMADILAISKRNKASKIGFKTTPIKQHAEDKKVPKKSKYGNTKIEYNGIKYDSKKEFNRAMELEQMQKIGLIKNLKRQVKYVLQPNFKFGKKTIREIAYIADFVYEQDGETIVEDVKSPITRKNPVYAIKKKMMMYVHKIEIKEI